MKFPKLLTLAAAVAAFAVPALTLPSPASAQETLKIGMTVSSAGRFALASQSGERGVQIWMDDVNRRGGLEMGGKKYKVELVKLDDRSDKQMVPRVYETLIQEQKVDLLFGPFGSTLTGAATAVTERSNKFLVIWSAASDSIYDQGAKYLISASQIASSMMAIPSVNLAVQLGGNKKIAIVYLDEPFPAGMAAGAEKLAKAKGMQVVQYEKFAAGTKDFSILIQKARASGADFFYPVAYEGDQMAMVRQMKEMNVNFPYTFMLYASQPQFQDIGKDAEYIYSHTLYHPAINWKVTDGLNREEVGKRYKALFPDVSYDADFQTALAYAAGVVTEKILTTAGTTDAAKMKEAALALSGKIVTMAGPYEIEESGKQVGMQNVVMQNMPGKGLQAVYPASVKTADPVFPVPGWDKR